MKNVTAWIGSTALMVAACGSGGASPTAPPSPVATPSVAPASDTVIGPEGGTVLARSGSFRLVIPAGALTAPTGISLRVLAPSTVDPRVVTSTEVAVFPSSTRFAVPATLVIGYDAALAPSGVPEGELQLHALAGAAWEPVAGATLDVAVHEASAQVAATGAFSVRWAGPRRPCSAAVNHEFDFWLGNWNFTAPNSFPGTDDVVRDATGCVIEETFNDRQTTGRSISLVSPLDGAWHQTYVDSAGGRLVLVGARDGGRMILHESATDRFVWEALTPDTVRYAGERTRDGGATWTVQFDARYTRR